MGACNAVRHRNVPFLSERRSPHKTRKAQRTIMFMEQTSKERVKELTEKLESGLTGIFSSDNYQNYLKVMSRFHSYSINNRILIYLQCPEASLVAGFQTWKKNGRFVKKGEKAIQIFAPCICKGKKKDDGVVTVDEAGSSVATNDDFVESEDKIVSFRVASVFDISQTGGDELPSITPVELNNDMNVDDYDSLLETLVGITPFSVEFSDAELVSSAKGCCSYALECIYIRPNMSRGQTIKTLIHEIAHSIMHSDKAMKLDRETKEVEAESVAYAVCQHLGIDTSDYSFSYIAGWSGSREMGVLRSSLDRISSMTSQLINLLDTTGCSSLIA